MKRMLPNALNNIGSQGVPSSSPTRQTRAAGAGPGSSGSASEAFDQALRAAGRREDAQSQAARRSETPKSPERLPKAKSRRARDEAAAAEVEEAQDQPETEKPADTSAELAPALAVDGAEAIPAESSAADDAAAVTGQVLEGDTSAIDLAAQAAASGAVPVNVATETSAGSDAPENAAIGQAASEEASSNNTAVASIANAPAASIAAPATATTTAAESEDPVSQATAAVDPKSPDSAAANPASARSPAAPSAAASTQRSGGRRTVSAIGIPAEGSPQADTADAPGQFDLPEWMTLADSVPMPDGALEQALADAAGAAHATANHPAAATDPSTALPPALSDAKAPVPAHPAAQAAGPNSPTATAAPSAPETEFAQSNHESIVRSIQGQLLPRGGSMQIRLDPPELGALKVMVEMRDGVMNATFQTSSDEATRLLSHSLGQLKHVLETQGMQVERIQVQQAPRNEQSNSSEDQRQQNQQQGDQWSDDHAARQEQQRKEMLRRMWRRVSGTDDPIDYLA